MSIICNPPDAFDVDLVSGEIKLKEYPDNLITYFTGRDSEFKLTESLGMKSPYRYEQDDDIYVTDDTTDVYTHIGKGKELTYYKNNFREFKSGCIRFTAKKENSDYDFCYQDLTGFRGVEPGLYSISIYSKTNGTDPDIIFDIQVFDYIEDVAALSSIINQRIEDDASLTGIFTTEPINDGLRFKSYFDTGTATKGYINISSTGNEDSLDVWFNKKLKPSYYCAPDVDTKIISFHEADSNKNEISIIHTADNTELLDGEAEPGYLYLYMVDETGEFTLTKKLCKWDWSNEDFTEFELNFDSSLYNFIVNGKVKAFDETVGVNENGDVNTIYRSDKQDQFLTLVNKGDAYGFKEIDIFDKKQHCGDYKAPATVDPEAYNKKPESEKAYVDYVIGDVKVYDDSELKITGDGDMILEALDNGVTLTNSEGIPVKASSIDKFISLFKSVDYNPDPEDTLSFEADNLIIRVTYLTDDTEITDFSFNPGSEAYDSSSPYNFEDLYGWVRRQCGAPQVTCELTDEQIYDALCKAVEKYNKYRNWNENLNIAEIDGPEETDLKKVIGTKAQGTYYQLPANVNDTDIIDIFFQPRFSVCWFGAGDNFLNNVMAQTFFGLYGGIVQNSADYYIHRISCNDISNIIGTQVSWRIYDHHLYFTPNNLGDLEQFTVGIKYRPSLTVEEIRSNENIKALTLGYAMKTLGLIRGSFGGSVQAGDIAIQLNAETLLAEGDKLITETIALLKSEQKPLWMIWT